MKIGRFEISWKKSYKQLITMLNREKHGNFDAKINPQAQLSEYKGWQFSAVSLISDRVSTIPFSLYNKETNEEITSRSHSYNIVMKPFLEPNYFMSFRFIKAFCQLQLDLCGISCILKVKNLLGQTWELWPLNMNDFNGVYDSKGMPIDTNTSILPSEIYYEFYVGGSRYFFSSRDLIILYYPHPKNQFVCASPIQAQAYAVDIDHYIEVYERDFFANSARVDMVLKTKETLEDGVAERIKQRWREKFSGKFHDIVVLDSDITPVPLNFTNKDFEFLALANWSQDKLLAAYRMPKEKLGISGQGANRSNSVYIDINFNRECILPRLNLWDEELTKEIVSKINSKLCIKHIDPIPRDRQLEFQEARVYLSGAPCQTINEARKVRNLKAIEGGDIILIPANFIPLDKYDEYVKNNLLKKEEVKPKVDPLTDPMHHEDDKPHLNPDGTDNRDDLPTDGRNFKDVEKTFSILWYYALKNYMLNKNKLEEKEVYKIFYDLAKSTIYAYFKLIDKQILFDSKKWLDSYIQKVAQEFNKTLQIGLNENSKEIKCYKEFNELVFKELDMNPRISKICNVTLRSCINYARFLIISSLGLNRIWSIDRNLCGHRGRLDKFITNNKFKIGDTELNFPGEIFNLSCDCKLTAKSDDIQLLD